MNKKGAVSLPELEEQFHAVINSVQNGIMAVDCQGILTLVNKMAEEILGIKRENLIGRSVVEVYPETLLLGILESKKPLLGQKLIVNGTVVMANYAPIMVNGKMNGAVSVFQDISVM
ncbi:MAG TPA: PAS domain S-box protein, partial [Negativicutes bacterium]|nr:PAS domain S-box protein [Negativicutes bacterium]